MTKNMSFDSDTADKIVSESPAIIYICKAYGDFAATFVTQNIMKAVGYTPEEFLSYPGFWADHIHPDDKEKVFNDLVALFENGHHEHDYRFLHKNGSYRWMHDELVLLKDESGEPVEILGYWNDVTDMKNTASQLEATLNATTDGIIVVNRDGLITGYNKKFLEMWTIADDVINSRDSEQVLNFILPLLYKPEKLTQSLGDLNNKPDAKTFNRIELVDGRMFEFYSEPQWVENNAIGRVWSFRNVTESEFHKQTLLAAKEQAERTSFAKINFLQSMGHELRTPLNAIMGFSQLLLSDTDEPLTSTQVENVKEVLNASELLLNMINDVLDLSMIETGKLDISIQKISLKKIIRQCLKLVMPLADKHQIQIIDTLSGNDDILVRVDPEHLIKVILILLTNGVKYNKAGGEVKIEAMTCSNDRLLLQITDTGYGISKNELDLIFEPFERLRYKNSTIEGAGIGLNVAKQLVEAMCGEIGVNSALDKGSVFWVELPLA